MRSSGKIIIFTIGAVLLLSVQSCLSQERQDSIAIAEKAEILKGLYSKAVSESGTEYQKQFFEAFPSSFSLFNKIYGFEDDTDGFNPNILYDVHLSHLNLFCSLKKSVNKKAFYKKIIILGINGHWQADAVGFLQHCTRETIKEDLPLTIEILENYSNEDIKSFWYFLFDGPHPSAAIPIDVEKIRGINSQIADLAEEAFREVHENAEPHGK